MFPCQHSAATPSWSPSSVSDRATAPYQGTECAGTKGKIEPAPGAGIEPAITRAKTSLPVPAEHPGMRALPPCRTERAALTGGGRAPARRARGEGTGRVRRALAFAYGLLSQSWRG